MIVNMLEVQSSNKNYHPPPYLSACSFDYLKVVIIIFYDDINDCNFIYIARFIIGWFIGGVPWYVGTLILMFVQMDCREESGLIACTIAVSFLLQIISFSHVLI